MRLSCRRERILTEAAIFADKANITEELVRLEQPYDPAEKYPGGSEGPVGKNSTSWYRK